MFQKSRAGSADQGKEKTPGKNPKRGKKAYI